MPWNPQSLMRGRESVFAAPADRRTNRRVAGVTPAVVGDALGIVRKVRHDRIQVIDVERINERLDSQAIPGTHP
jgi:hypothetical protein